MEQEEGEGEEVRKEVKYTEKMIEKIKSLDNRTYKKDNSQDPHEPKFRLKSKIGELMNLTKTMGE